jgi:methionyl aminopeptidase
VIQLKSSREIDLMAQGGRILGQTLKLLRDSVRPGMTTAELDRIAEEFIRGHEGAVPAFKGLYGFPRHTVAEARAPGGRHRVH